MKQSNIDNKSKRAAAPAASVAAAAGAAALAADKAAKCPGLEAQERENARKTQEMSKDKFFRINMTLPIELDKVLEDIGIEARSSGGFKIPKTTAVRALIRVAKIIQPDFSGVKTEQEVLERLMEAIKRYKGK